MIGLDFNLEMLALARKYQGEVTERLGYDNLSLGERAAGFPVRSTGAREEARKRLPGGATYLAAEGKAVCVNHPLQHGQRTIAAAETAGD